MGTKYYQLYYHFIWGTYKRLNLIDPKIEQELERLIRDKVIEKKSQLICFGCTDNHIHLNVKLHPAVSVSEIVGQIKGYSSYMIANHLDPENEFRWQRGFGALTLSKQDLPRIIKYVEQQKEHHSNNDLLFDCEIPKKVNHTSG